MASSLPSFYAATFPFHKQKYYSRTSQSQSLQVRANSFRDEGRSRNIVDENLIILRERIEEVRMKERLERCCRAEHGWNYLNAPVYDYKHRNKKVELSSRVFELTSVVGGTVGLTILSGTFGLFLFSLLLQLNQ